MGIAVVSVPAPHHLPSSQFSYTSTKYRLHGPRTLKTHPSSTPLNLLRSSTCCSASVVEEGPPPPPDDSFSVKSEPVIEDTDKLPLRYFTKDPPKQNEKNQVESFELFNLCQPFIILLIYFFLLCLLFGFRD